MLGGGNSGAWQRPARTSVCPAGQPPDGDGGAVGRWASRNAEVKSAATLVRVVGFGRTEALYPDRENRQSG